MVSLITGLVNLFVAALVIALSVPLLRGRVKPNQLYGARFERAFESEALWYDINRYSARQLIGASVVVALAGVASFFLPLETRPGLAAVLALAPLVYLVSCVQAYRYAQTRPGRS